MPFTIQIVPSALAELKAIRVYHRRQIARAIDEQLADQPTVETRNRKVVLLADASFAFDPPLRELRVGDFRVFYRQLRKQRNLALRGVTLLQPRRGAM